MRDRRVKPAATESAKSARGARRWALVLLAICVAWVLGMVAVSLVGYEHRSPVRIENWHPDRQAR